MVKRPLIRNLKEGQTRSMRAFAITVTEETPFTTPPLV
jgi:hypothetical protein